MVLKWVNRCVEVIRRAFETCLVLKWLSFVFKEFCGTLRSVWWL